MFINIFNLNAQNYLDLGQTSEDMIETTTIAFKSPLSPNASKKKIKAHYKNGRMMSMESYTKGKLTLRENYEYTNQENKEIIKKSSSKRIRDNVKINYYDDEGRIIKVINNYRRDTTSFGSVLDSFEYSPTGKLERYQTTSIASNGEEVKYCYETKYDKDGRVIGYSLYYLCSELRSETTVEYAKDNTATVTTTKQSLNKEIDEDESNSKIIKRLYLFDKRGNWIKVYSINDKGKKKLRMKRKITYEEL